MSLALASCDTSVLGSFDGGVAKDAAAGDLASGDLSTHGDGGAPDLAGSGCGPGDTFQAAYTATLSTCSGIIQCHGRAPFGAELDLGSAATAYAQLVGVPATQALAKDRVVPGDPDRSFLVQKLTNTQGVDEGDPMPRTEGLPWHPPDAEKLRVLRCWILRGALDD